MYTYMYTHTYIDTSTYLYVSLNGPCTRTVYSQGGPLSVPFFQSPFLLPLLSPRPQATQGLRTPAKSWATPPSPGTSATRACVGRLLGRCVKGCRSDVPYSLGHLILSGILGGTRINEQINIELPHAGHFRFFQVCCSDISKGIYEDQHKHEYGCTSDTSTRKYVNMY